jgi:hypothetical protein
MEEEFISYEQALALKELGFDEKCFKTYNEDKELIFYCTGKYYYPAPLKQQVFRWFMEKYKLVHEINVYSTTDGYAFSFKILCKKYTPFIDANDTWTTYEEAENACIDKLIEIAKQQDK